MQPIDFDPYCIDQTDFDNPEANKYIKYFKRNLHTCEPTRLDFIKDTLNIILLSPDRQCIIGEEQKGWVVRMPVLMGETHVIFKRIDDTYNLYTVPELVYKYDHRHKECHLDIPSIIVGMVTKLYQNGDYVLK
jgi:hypothetical protein